jgi:hypothetical protein
MPLMRMMMMKRRKLFFYLLFNAVQHNLYNVIYSFLFSFLLSFTYNLVCRSLPLFYIFLFFFPISLRTHTYTLRLYYIEAATAANAVLFIIMPCNPYLQPNAMSSFIIFIEDCRRLWFSSSFSSSSSSSYFSFFFLFIFISSVLSKIQ